MKISLSEKYINKGKNAKKNILYAFYYFSLGDKLTKKALTQSSLVDQRQILAKTRGGKKIFSEKFLFTMREK